MKIRNKILITGVAGFIGFSLAEKILKNKNVKVVGIDNLNEYYSKKLKLERLKILKKKKNFKFFNVDLVDKKRIKNIFKKKQF